MADNTTQSVNQAQDATRSTHQTLQDLMGVQMNVFQRLGEAQRKAFSQAVEATNAQFHQLLKQAVDITVQAWQEYGDHLGKTVNTVTDKAQRAASPSKAT
jgi:TRAP-type C4-dicarboxylate transport system substrate-binding protein